MPDTFNDLQIVRRYIDMIAIFIEGIVQEDGVAIVLACEVFVRHKKRETSKPFATEEEREQFLYVCARNRAIDYLQHQRHEKEKAQALSKAIHDCP